MHQQTPTDFEERLLSRLQATVAERGAAEAAAEAARVQPVRRRAPRLALGGAVAAAAVTAGLIVSAGGDNAPAAYAVEPQAHGGVDIQVYSLSDPDGLEGVLEEAGIPADITYLPAGTICERQYRSTTLKIPGSKIEPAGSSLGAFTLGGPSGPMTISIGDEQQRNEMLDGVMEQKLPIDSIANLFLNPDWFGPDQTLVISGSSHPEYRADIGVAEGPVPACNVVPLPD